MSTPVPWFPWGWMLVAGLVIVMFYALVPFALGIQKATKQAAQTALFGVGAPWASVEVSGQHVTLRGTPPSPEAAAQAEAAVWRAQSDTWFGRWVPATAVRTAFTTEAEAEPAPEPGYEWSFRTENGVLELTGEVPDAATRRALEDAARRSLDPPRLVDVHNQLVVTEGEVPEGFVAVAERGIVNVASCDMGVAEFSCQRYSLLCELPQSRAEAVRASASTPLPYGRLGSVQVLANEAVASCEQGLAKVLERSTIQFDTDSDQIDASSGTVLDEVASAAGDCPGTLRIEGHTDNTGDRATNDALSQRRAASVRRALVDRGLPQSRLVAQGYGDRDPVADNRTRTGRSRNRRIEIRVVRASD